MPARRHARPAEVLRNSPLAAAPRMLSLRASQRPRPRMAWRRALAISGSVLVHILFLFAFVLGPAWQPPVHDHDAQLKARFIELPDLAPPPPPKGELARQVGALHQGHAAARATAAAKTAAAATRKPSAAPAATPSLPQPAPAPDLQAVPQASQVPTVNLAPPALAVPVPPKFQPKPVRAPQVEGKQAPLPPPSLAMPVLPPSAPPTVAAPSIALDKLAPSPVKPALAPPSPVALSAPPPAPALEAVPVAAPVAPQVSVQTAALHAPAPVAVQLSKLAPAVIEPAEQPLAAIPQADTRAAQVSLPDKTKLPLAPLPAPGKLAALAPVTLSAQEPAAGKPDEAGPADVSRAPHAVPEGSDTARVGAAQGSTTALPSLAVHGNGPANSHDVGKATKAAAGGNGDSGLPTQAASPASAQAGSSEPAYIQLKPTGDTAVMRHNVRGVDYKPTRFEADWAPANESALDSALRRAAEKTTVTHTFHLPRGIRIKCAVMPLVPVALLGCGNADKPPGAAAQKMYDRLNLPAPKGGSVPSMPTPATSTPPAAAPVKLGNAAICAEARLTGGPQPPGCPPLTPQQSEYHPASSSSSWVPASDQFH